MVLELGNVYWLKKENPSEEDKISHPHVVFKVEDSLIHLSGLTTNLKRANWPGCVILEKGEANLQKISVVDVSRISKISKERLGEYVGRVSPQKLIDIQRGIKLIQTVQDRSSQE